MHERLKLNGSFVLDQARFTSAKIQGRIAELSLRGQGRPGDVKTTDPASILSRMQEQLSDGGRGDHAARAGLHRAGSGDSTDGTYGMEDGALNFAGTAKMRRRCQRWWAVGRECCSSRPTATSRRTERDGGSDPHRGTREEPEFGIDFDRMKPDEKR